MDEHGTNLSSQWTCTYNWTWESRPRVITNQSIQVQFESQNVNKNCWKQKASMFYQELPLQRQKRKPRLHLVRRRGVKEVRVTPVKVATGILPLTFLEPVTTWQDMCANSWKRCWRWYTIHIGHVQFIRIHSSLLAHMLQRCFWRKGQTSRYTIMEVPRRQLAARR